MNPIHPPIRLAALIGLSVALHPASSYQLVDLGPGTANAVNSSGRIVGNGPTGGWTHDGTNRTALVATMRYLGDPTGPVFNLPVSEANGISDNGTIVGSQVFGAGGPGQQFRNALIYPGTGAATLLNTGQIAYGVNDSGVVVGLGFRFDGTAESALPGGAPILYGVNNAGVAVGTVAGATTQVPARFVSGVWEVLNLEGLPQVGLFPWTGEARAINSDGVIVGSVYLARQRPLDPRFAFILANGVSANLGSLGGLQSIALALNDSGVVVGTSEDPARAWHAFVHEGGTIADLNTKLSGGGEGWVLTTANGINASGSIVGTGLKNGETRAYLLVPSGSDLPPIISRQPTDAAVFVGEPFSLSVLGSGEGPLTYQWQREGTNIAIAVASTYAVTNALLDEAGAYRVVVSNGAGSVTSSVARVEIKVRPELSLLNYAGISVRGVVGKTYRIEAADAPAGEWQSVKTLTLKTSPTLWFDEESPSRNRRVYRVVEVP